MFPLHHCHQNAKRDTGEFGLSILYRFPGATLHLGQGWPLKPGHIRLQGSPATVGTPAILLEDSRPQAILIFNRSSSLDYRARQGLPVYLRHVLSAKVFQKHSKLLQNLFKEIEFQSREICILICNFSSMLIYESLKGSTMFTYFYHQVYGPSNTYNRGKKDIAICLCMIWNKGTLTQHKTC